MKKFRILGLGLMLCLALSLGIVLTNSGFAAAFATDNKSVATGDFSIEVVTREIFGDQKIKSTEYLHNYDDSTDYIYVDFEDYGYAIFFKDTMEMLEYSPQGSLPFENTRAKRYYGGPTNYLQKEGELFRNVATGDIFVLNTAEATNYSREMRSFLLNSNQELRTQKRRFSDISVNVEKESNKNSPQLKTNPPNMNTGTHIIPTGGNGKLIVNSNYFTTNPTHGDNYTGGSYGNGNSGTCGAVAAQLLLTYNNYYNDRRIIENRFLNGFSDAANAVTIPARNPNLCADPMNMTRWTLGSRSEDTGANSYYSNVVTTIMPANTSGATVNQVRNGMRTLLGNRLANNQFTVDSDEKGWFFGWSPISSTPIKNQIDAERPLIIGMSLNLGGVDHFVVGYGYEDYTYPATGNTYSGYVVHFGSQVNTNVWVNSSWCDSYITMEMNHTHAHAATGTILDGQRMVMECAGCGHRTTADLYNISGGTITGARHTLTGSITIPSVINGTTITAIGNSAFANQTQLSQITIPASVTKIGWEAFSPYTVLTSYGGSLEDRADIDFVVASGTLDTYLANGWTGFNNVELSASGALSVTSGQLRGVVEVPITFNNRAITAIGSSGFANQTQITGITIMSATTIGSNAFANCTNLEDILYYSQTGLASTPNHSTSYSNYYYTERSLDISLLPDVVYTLSFDYSNLTSSTSISNVFTSLGVGENTFAVDLPVQKTFSSTSGTQVIVFTPTEAQLSSSSKLWCRFIRTSTPQSVSINISNVRLDMGVTSISSNSFTGCEKLATPRIILSFA